MTKTSHTPKPLSTIEFLQVPAEFEPLRDLYREAAPKRVLEIGCWEGGTMREWLSVGRPELVVAVDLEHRNPAGYEVWRDPSTELVVITGSSQQAGVIEQFEVRAPYDWVFIDGDHGVVAVRKDVESTLPLVRAGGKLILHDIARGTNNDVTEPTGPRVIFTELAERYAVDWYIEDWPPVPWAHGIGVVHVNE